MNSAAVDHSPAPADGQSSESTGKAMIYTRMGVVFHASAWSESVFGVKAGGVWSTGATSMEVFLPWTSIDSIRFG